MSGRDMFRQEWETLLPHIEDWLRTGENTMETMMLAFHNADDLSEIVRWSNAMIGNPPDDDNLDYTVTRVLHFQIIPQNGKFDVVFLVEVRRQIEEPDWVKQEY